jgi:hypothetical protein
MEVTRPQLTRRFARNAPPAAQCVAQAAGELALLSAPALADVLTEPLLVGWVVGVGRGGRGRWRASVIGAAPILGLRVSLHARPRAPASLRPPATRDLAILPANQSVPEFLKFEVVALWACYGHPPPSPLAAAGGTAAFAPERPGSSGGRVASNSGAEEPEGARAPRGSSSSSGGGGGRSSGAGQPPTAAAGLAGSEAYRPAAELSLVVPLVRFVLMGQEDLQVSVLAGAGARSLVQLRATCPFL